MANNKLRVLQLMRLLLEENEMRRIYADTACRGILIHLLTKGNIHNTFRPHQTPYRLNEL